MDTAVTVCQLAHAEEIFAGVTDIFLARTRRVMCVPEQADADVEREFADLRQEFAAFLPEFRAIFTDLLLKHIGSERLSEVLVGMRKEHAQRYLRAAPLIDRELDQHMARLREKMNVIAQHALAAVAG